MDVNKYNNYFERKRTCQSVRKWYCSCNQRSNLVSGSVDDDINVDDPSDVEYAMATRFQGDKGLIVIPNAKGSSLDPSADQISLITTKMGIDATASLSKPKGSFERMRIPGEEKIRLED